MAIKRTAESEHIRLEGMRVYEKEYASCGVICGIDEAGRGPLAGPVVAAAAVLPMDYDFFYLDDSKKVTERRREILFEDIRQHAITFGIGTADEATIDEINILQATYQAMRSAVSQLDPAPVLTLNDAVTIPGLTQKQVPLIKGDSLSVSIAAASILAKVTRDHYMMEMDAIYPEYGFARHKGYGTADHIRAIRKYGPCPIHRRSFLKNILGEN